MKRFIPPLYVLALFALNVSGCLLVRTTEHRVRMNSDGSGEALMRLIDIRSDGETDSAVTADFNELMSSYHDSTLAQFENQIRKITRRQFVVSGDTLTAEIAYIFSRLEAVEGLRMKEDEIYVVVDPSRRVVRTNGDLEEMETGGVRIVWDRDTPRLQYEISERVLPPGTPLGPRYRQVLR